MRTDFDRGIILLEVVFVILLATIVVGGFFISTQRVFANLNDSLKSFKSNLKLYRPKLKQQYCLQQLQAQRMLWRCEIPATSTSDKAILFFISYE